VNRYFAPTAIPAFVQVVELRVVGEAAGVVDIASARPQFLDSDADFERRLPWATRSVKTVETQVAEVLVERGIVLHVAETAHVVVVALNAPASLYRNLRRRE
jgi:hypothetical protein